MPGIGRIGWIENKFGDGSGHLCSFTLVAM